MFSLPPLKAPWPDGYRATFFQKIWHIVGPSVIQVIQEIFENMTISVDWDLTNLVLILNVSHPEMITQFQPISLCNTLYKVVSKIILQRLKPYIVDIINHCVEV